MTSVTLSHGRTPSGRSSYELLALDVRALPHAARSILDLACGDGYLLQVLAQEFPQARLVGVDMSPEELASARMRLAGRAELQLATADALPLEDGVCDAVTCHFAFMLMDDAPSIVKEVSRVLVSGGIFAAVINGARSQDPVLAAFTRALQHVEAAENLPPLLIGDPRVQSETHVREMFDEHFADVDLCADVLCLDGTQDQVRAALMGFYNLHRLSSEGYAFVKQRVDEAMAQHADAGGIVPCSLPIRHIVAKKR